MELLKTAQCNIYIYTCIIWSCALKDIKLKAWNLQKLIMSYKILVSATVMCIKGDMNCVNKEIKNVIKYYKM